MQPQEVKQDIKNLYANFAETGMAQEHHVFLASPNYAFCRKRYGQTDLSAIPKTALSLACGSGNPLFYVEVRPGSKVVDLGCGGGIDVILAAGQLEGQGKVLGIDIVPEMLEAAQQAVVESGLQHEVFFRVIDIEDIYPLPKNFADVVTANNIINLCPDRVTVYKNIYRILKPGGILIVSDFVLTDEIEPQLHMRLQADHTSCLARIASSEDHLSQLKKFTFDILQVELSPLSAEDLETIGCYPIRNLQSPPSHDDILLLHGKVAVATIVAKRRPLN